MFKKVLALLVAGLLVGASFGCGGGSVEEKLGSDDPRLRDDWEELTPLEKAKAKRDAGENLSPKERNMLDRAEEEGEI